MNKFNKCILVLIVCALLPGCAAIKAASGLLGSSSSNSGKQTTVTTSAKFGDNSEHTGIGTSNTSINAKNAKNLTVTNQRPWYSEFQSHATTLLIIVVFLLFLFGIIALFRRSPSDKRLIDYLIKQNREVSRDVENLFKKCLDILIDRK